jgi:hypothetical protein
MPEDGLVLLEEVAGAGQAEVLRGLLEAQDIHVLLSQESASSAIPVSFGILGDVKIMVKEEDLERAREILEEYYAGEFDRDEESAAEEEGE